MIPGLRDAYYYVLRATRRSARATSRCRDDWRLLGPIIAMSGLFTFGWTGSVLVSIMTEFGKLDRARAEARRKKPRPDNDAAHPEAQRRSRPGFAPPPQGPTHDVLLRELAARGLAAGAGAVDQHRPSSGASPAGGAGDHVAHVHEAVGLLGQRGGVVARLAEADVVADGAVAPQPPLEEGAGDQAFVGERRGSRRAARWRPSPG